MRYVSLAILYVLIVVAVFSIAGADWNTRQTITAWCLLMVCIGGLTFLILLNLSRHQMLMDKPTRLAVRNHLPMYWRANGRELHLYAVTTQFENGSGRIRRLHATADIQDALLVSQRILEAGGALDVSALDWNSLDLWRYGWTPALGDLRQRVITMRPTVAQPDWAGYSAEMKSHAK